MFRFIIRDILWLTLLAAVVVAWLEDRRRMSAEIERLRPPIVAVLEDHSAMDIAVAARRCGTSKGRPSWLISR
jgi:hypothetical protein